MGCCDGGVLGLCRGRPTGRVARRHRRRHSDALFTAEELRGGFARLAAAGFVRAERRTLLRGRRGARAGEEGGLSLAAHGEEIAAFLAASNYRGTDPEGPDPDLSDEKIRQAVEDYLAPFRQADAGNGERRQ